ncbi:hypothetical protein DFH06DRAFT_1335511 [Mycena polygramma]|nr:hypothetical protein DFH06DRAFT_1335511 [Mycena polygramma]
MSTAQKHGKNDRNAAPSKPIVSPKKARRTETSDDDTSRHLPELCTNRDRPSPAQRKISGSGAVRVPGPDGISSVAFGAGNNAAGFNLPFRAPTTPKRRLQRNHSTSPTPSRRLDTGHHETDVESDLEEGQISEILPPLVFQETHLNETAKTAAAGKRQPNRYQHTPKPWPHRSLLPPPLRIAPAAAAPAAAAPADAAPADAAPADADPAAAAPAAAAPAAAAPAASTTTRRVTIEEIEDEDAGSGRQTPPLRLWEPVIVAVAAQSDIPPAAAAARPHDTPPVAIIDVDMPQATTTPADVIDVDAPMPAPEDTRARQAEQAYAAPGPAAHPFVFADAQQAVAHGAAADRGVAIGGLCDCPLNNDVLGLWGFYMM